MNRLRWSAICLNFSLIFQLTYSPFVRADTNESVENQEVTCLTSSDENEDVGLTSSCRPNLNPLPDASQDISNLADNLSNTNLEEQDTTPECNETKFKQMNLAQNPNDVATAKKQFLDECIKMFKEHKKKVARELLKKGRLFAALQVRLQSKKRIKVREGTLYQRTSREVTVEEGQLDSEIKKLESELLAGLKEKYPDVARDADQIYNDNGRLLRPSYNLEMKGRMTMPTSLRIGPAGEQCKVKITPAEFHINPRAESSLIPPLDMNDNFPDDCTYLVSDQLNEQAARGYLTSDLSQNARPNWCGDRQVIDDADRAKGKKALADLDRVVDMVANNSETAVPEGFAITVARNHYRDTVVNLALKRGQFIQNYLRENIIKKLKAAGKPIPAWIDNASEFASVVPIRHPESDGNTPGNYGPNPYVQDSQVDAEVTNFENTTRRELVNIQAQSENHIAKLKALKTRADKIPSELSKAKREYEELQTKIGNPNNYKVGRTQFNNALFEQDKQKLIAISQRIYQLEVEKVHNAGDIEEQQKMVNYYGDIIQKRYSNISGRVSELRSFYQGRTMKNNDGTYEIPDAYKQQFFNLFEPFKVARIEGRMVPNDRGEVDVEDDGYFQNPKINYIISRMIQLKGFECNYGLKKVKTFRPYRHIWNFIATIGLYSVMAVPKGLEYLQKAPSCIKIGNSSDPRFHIPLRKWWDAITIDGKELDAGTLNNMNPNFNTPRNP